GFTDHQCRDDRHMGCQIVHATSWRRYHTIIDRFVTVYRPENRLFCRKMPAQRETSAADGPWSPKMLALVGGQKLRAVAWAIGAGPVGNDGDIADDVAVRYGDLGGAAHAGGAPVFLL